MAVDKSLISGSTTMLILRLLEGKDMYGYEMIETLQEKSQNVFQLKAGTLYPLLHSLDEKGYVSSYEDSIAQKKEEWKEYSSAVANILTADRNTIFPALKPQMEG